MARIQWDKIGERYYETGIDRGVLYVQSSNGLYPAGVPWSGLTALTESPSGAESTPQYADNIKYLNLKSVEEFSGTIEAFTWPTAWEQCDGSAEPVPGVRIGQQRRKNFGLAYRTRIGNDTAGDDYGYKIHLVWGADAAPSEKAYNTINDSPEATAFSWEFMTTPVTVGVIGGTEYKPTASMTISSTDVPAANLQALEDILYGTEGVTARLPLPAEVIALFDGTVTAVTAVAPSYNSTTDEVTIPVVTGVIYSVDGQDVSGTFPITESIIVHARPDAGYVLAAGSDDDFYIEFV